jgi:NAD+ synthase (glutamine-hydrolysing)
MKTALAQLNFHIGNFELNTEKIIRTIHRAKADGAVLVVFPELAVCGYPPLDFLDFRDFVRKCHHCINTIAGHTDGIGVILGSPSFNPVLKGKNLFNSAFYLENGQTAGLVHKALLPNYDVFDEYRYFEPGRTFHCIECRGVKIALTICEDLWNEEDDPLYRFCPMDELVKERPQLIINIAASPFDYQHAEKRKSILKRNALKYGLPVVYVNHVGGQTEMLFDGGSLVMNEKGETIKELNYFSEDYCLIDFPLKGKTAETEINKNKTERIHDALIMGIRDYFGKQGFKQATLGLSGGIDSAVVLALAAEALGSENVFPVMMPSPYSSEHSLTDSEELAENLRIKCITLPVHKPFESYLELLKPVFNDLPFDVTEENLQARIRGTLLMALCNKYGYILLNTSNKSELAVGYGTLYGDMCGGLSVIGDVYKTEVYDLARYLNRKQTIIPLNIISKPPSAELRPGQKDTDSLPPYEMLDAILRLYIEQQYGPVRIVEAGFDEALVLKVLRMVNRNEHKRFQAPPILRVSPKAFGLGRRMPIVGKYLG